MYVTVAEFKNAPTGIDTSTIIPGSTQAQNDAELYNVLVRASAWVDKICNQTLEASTNTEVKEVTMNNSGLIRIHPNNSPIITLLDSVGYRVDPNGPFIPLPINNIQVLSRYFVIYNLNNQAISPALALQYPAFGYYSPQKIKALQRIPMTVQYTYVNGYINTSLSASVTGGATVLPLSSVVGAYVGQVLTIYDNEKTESITVQSVGSNNITLTAPIIFDHASKIPVSALPASVKEATILLAAYLIKERGSLSISMNETSLQGVNRYKDASDVDTAKELLGNYKRGMTS